MIKKSITIILLISTCTLYAQEFPQKEIDLELLADELFGFQDLDLNYEELYENIALLLANKINLNKASAEELRFLNLLSEYQVQNLITYRETVGPLLSVYELQSVPGFDLPIINKIIPFVRVEDPAMIGSLWKRILSEQNNYLILRYGRTLESKKGFSDDTSPASKFKGSEDALYMRFRTSKTGDFSLGFTVEKDAGEEIVWNNAARYYAFDYGSFHAQLLNKGKLKNIIVGDFQSQFGQGLVLGGSFGLGKGAEAVTTVRRSNLGFLPYTSVNEIGFKRGVALTYQLLPRVYLSTYGSVTWRDGSLSQDSLEDSSISALPLTGFHRNESELKNRKQLHETIYGGVLQYKHNAVDAGVIIDAISYNIPIQRNPQPYNQFALNGDQNTNVSLYINYTLNNFTLFSEAAKSINGGYATVLGLLGSVTPKLDVALHLRNYQRNFISPYGNAFAESTLPQNETGIYWGWKYRWNRTFSTSGYADLFRFPWLRFNIYSPSEGYEWLLRFNYQPTRNILLFIQMREESKSRNITSNEPNLYQTSQGIKRNYWANADYRLTPAIALKTRAQFSTFTLENTTTRGMVLLQDINLSFRSLTVTARYALFDTDNYDNRQYVYERDVWLAYSLPAYTDTGIRNFILVQYDINKRFTCWIRWARTRYSNQNEIGSGADAILGDTRTDIKAQLRIRF